MTGRAPRSLRDRFVLSRHREDMLAEAAAQVVQAAGDLEALCDLLLAHGWTAMRAGAFRDGLDSLRVMTDLLDDERP